MSKATRQHQHLTRQTQHLTRQQIHLVSLGCPKNTVDSERMLGLLEGNGYEITADPQQADVIIVNTCGFIEPAKEESIEAVMAAHRLRQEGRCQGIIVTGCLSQRYEQELRRDLVEADDILTISQEADIVRHVDQLLGKTRPRYIGSLPRRTLTPSHWAYLRIADGCDHECAFCAIPAIRGTHRSQPLGELVVEAAGLVAAGARELVLVSQDSVRYGADLYGRPRLVPLLEELAELDGLDWLRLMYTYPAFWTEEMLAFYAGNATMCRYVDLPLQHISDPVLVRMRRATTKAKTLDLITRLRERIPGVGMRSSFIVGFPGETEEQFEELLEFVEASRFDHLVCFMYSPEEGTVAYELDGEVPAAVKEERYGRLTELQDRICADINHGMVGSCQIVLIDGTNEDGELFGRLERDAPEIDGQVVIQGTGPGVQEVEAGRFAEVEITGASPYELTARVVGRIW